MHVSAAAAAASGAKPGRHDGDDRTVLGSLLCLAVAVLSLMVRGSGAAHGWFTRLPRRSLRLRHGLVHLLGGATPERRVTDVRAAVARRTFSIGSAVPSSWRGDLGAAAASLFALGTGATKRALRDAAVLCGVWPA